MENTTKLDLINIGEDAPNVVEKALNGADERTPHEKELDRLYLLERKLYIMNNMMNSGTVQGDGITRVVNYTIADEFNRKTIEHKIMEVLDQI